MTGEIERIAAGLTEAQRRFIVTTPRGGWPTDKTVLTGSEFAMLQRLESRGLFAMSAKLLSNDAALTPLGLQVRAHLEQHHAKD